MSTYALVHFPNIDTANINALRDEYDPYRNLIDVQPISDLRLLFGFPYENCVALKLSISRDSAITS